MASSSALPSSPTVRQVDLLNRTIRPNVGETKSGDGRIVVMTSDVYTLIQASVAGKGSDDYVFTRSNGKRLAGFRKAWANLVRAAGVRICSSMTSVVLESVT